MNGTRLLFLYCVIHLALSAVACGGEEKVAEPDPNPDFADMMDSESDTTPTPTPDAGATPTPDADPVPDADPIPDADPVPDADPIPDTDPVPDVNPPNEGGRLQVDVAFERNLGTGNHQQCAIVGVTNFSYTLKNTDEQTVAEESGLTCEDLPLVIDVAEVGTFNLTIEATSAGSTWEATCTGLAAVEGEVVETDCAVGKITEEPLSESLHIDLTWALHGMPPIGEECGDGVGDNYALQFVYYTLRDSQGQVVFTNITEDPDVERVGLLSDNCDQLDLTFEADLIEQDTYTIDVEGIGYRADHSLSGLGDIYFRPFWKSSCSGLNVIEGANARRTCEVTKLNTTFAVVFLLEDVEFTSDECFNRGVELNYQIFNGANELFDERSIDCMNDSSDDGLIFRLYGQSLDIGDRPRFPVPPDNYRIEASGSTASQTWTGSCHVEVSEGEDAIVGCALELQ